MNALIEVEGFTMELGDESFRRPVLEDVTLRVEPGRCLGIVGESGSGKSLLTRALLGSFPAGATVHGRITVAGTVVTDAAPEAVRALRSSDVGIVFQDPRASVNPLHPIGDFLTEAVVRSGQFRPDEARTRAVELLTTMRLPAPETLLKRYPDELSGGMLQRVVIAAAMMPAPSILLCDEATTALDVTTQAEIVRLLRGLQDEMGIALVLVTHDLELAGDLCDDLCVLYAGQVQEYGPTDSVLDAPKHPYTSALLASIPRIGDCAERTLPVIPGNVLPLTAESKGCLFAPRCADYEPSACDLSRIALRQSDDRQVRCERVSA
ncbi:ABC transporter ATP-binding protein [Leifsonia sp. YAF41]|uniref:ABC transporter ATP-binding protein n=1 Tax=Leifsonia sp. YAF41 TaxID=3233086 RepID=UPI003F9A47D4